MYFGSENINGFLETGGQLKTYYAKKEGDKKFFDLNYDGAVVNKFKTQVSKYFKDYPSLAAKVKPKELVKVDVVEICKMYYDCQ